MRIENQRYVGVVAAFRVPNRHASRRFRYSITRNGPPRVLMIAGSSSTEEEACGLVRRYLEEFAEHDRRAQSSRNTAVPASRERATHS